MRFFLAMIVSLRRYQFVEVNALITPMQDSILARFVV